MAKQILTAERLREVVSYDPETGIFTRKVRLAQRHHVGDRADFVVSSGQLSGYCRLSIDSERYLAHRCAWLYVHGEWPTRFIDHINGDKSDNRIANLRDVPAMVNLQNKRRARRDNRSCGVLGVSRAGKRWKSVIHANGQRFYLGAFDTPEEAHAAYLEAKRKHHPGCGM